MHIYGIEQDRMKVDLFDTNPPLPKEVKIREEKGR